jgi:hypothetical protein
MQLRHSAGLGVALHAAHALALSPLHWLGRAVVSQADDQPSAAAAAAAPKQQGQQDVVMLVVIG